MSVALTALEATIHIQGTKGERSVPIDQFFLLPGDTPHRETVVEAGELITFVTLPPPSVGNKSIYLKLRDRASYEFALASAAVVASVQQRRITRIRIALGGVGTKPWRSLEAETALDGKTANEEHFRAAAEAALRDAHRENIGRLYRSARDLTFSAYLDERRPPFEDDVIYYNGQYVALAVAETFEQAQAAAAAVQVVYSAEKPDLSNNLEPEGKLKIESIRGDTEAAFATAPVKIDETYVTPVETHNPMELHASVSIWDGSKFTLYETTQGVVNHRAVMAQVLGVPKENVQVISLFLGSGFDGKLFPWPHSALAAAASRDLYRPVKLVISRSMMFSNVGHRPLTQQRVRLAATQRTTERRKQWASFFIAPFSRMFEGWRGEIWVVKTKPRRGFDAGG
jgi:CO/xanthine dehydrogenase Mo-binding subunit